MGGPRRCVADSPVSLVVGLPVVDSVERGEVRCSLISSSDQGHRRLRRRMWRRSVVMIRPATFSSRKRNRLGSQLRGAGQASNWVQVSSS